MKKNTTIDLDRLTTEIREIKYWHPLFKLLKRELAQLGHWRNKERGDPRKGFITGMGKNHSE